MKSCHALRRRLDTDCVSEIGPLFSEKSASRDFLCQAGNENLINDFILRHFLRGLARSNSHEPVLARLSPGGAIMKSLCCFSLKSRVRMSVCGWAALIVMVSSCPDAG